MRFLRAVLLSVAFLAAFLLALITLNLAHFGPIRIVRFRETTLVLEAALLLSAVLRRHPGAYIAQSLERLRRIVAGRHLYLASLFVMLALYVISTLTQHWAFRTGSHDFSMIDEALFQSHHGRFLFSPVLGRSFLSEHFSPILIPLIPLHALAPTPYLLVVLQALALWASAPVLRAILLDEGVADATANLATVIYLNHALMVSTLNYVFHMECFLPLAVFAMELFRRRGPLWAYAGCALLGLLIKEDVGLYLAGYAAYLGIVERRRVLALATGAVGLAWSLVAVRVLIPGLADHAGAYVFQGRWSHWGEGWGGIALGFARHPIELVQALLARPYLELFLSLLFLPFLSPSSLMLIAVPWVLNATSGLPIQAKLSLYYGIPLLAFAAIASVRGLGAPAMAGRRWIAPAAACLAVVLNVSNLSLPEIPRQRRDMVKAIRAVPASATMQVMACLYPVAGYERIKRTLLPGDPLTADVVVLWEDGPTWPFTRQQARDLAREALESGEYHERSRIPGFHVLSRRMGEEQVQGRGTPSRAVRNRLSQLNK